MPIPAGGSLRALIAALNRHLLDAHADGRRVVLIVDEAQTLGPELLEQVRLLTNLETPTQKLLQIILIGQPELRDLLKRPEMRQIAQRVTGRYHLEPLSRAETAQYVQHRLRVAGCQAAIFTERAIGELYRRSKGIPRLINVVADRALLAGYTRDRTRIDAGLVRSAAAEVFGKRFLPFSWPWAAAAMSAACAAIALGAMALWGGEAPGRTATETRAATVIERTAVGMSAAPVPRSGSPAIGNAEPARASASAEHAATRSPAGPESPRGALAELLANPAAETDADSAFSVLFELWNARYDAARGEPCAQAAEAGLKCLFRSTGS